MEAPYRNSGASQPSAVPILKVSRVAGTALVVSEGVSCHGLPIECAIMVWVPSWY
jgi:hypothetical protein